jgi:hypothetical protein
VSSFVAPVLEEDEEELELSLRPRRLDDFVGQERVKEQLQIALTAAKARGEALDHVLLAGPPGLGKTSLAYIVREELGVGIRTIAGPAVEKKDIAAILTSLEPRDVLFVDEIHRMSRTAEEILYPALEDFRIDIVMGEGAAARTLTLDLPPFTMVGATTRTGLLTTPLRDRFGLTFRLDYYDAGELGQIVHRSARILGVEIAKDAAAHREPDPPPRARRRTGSARRLDHERDCARGVAPARDRRAGARSRGTRAAAFDCGQVRRRPGWVVDARCISRRRAGDDRGRLRAVPLAAGLHPADAPWAHDHEARARAHRRDSCDGRGEAFLTV